MRYFKLFDLMAPNGDIYQVDAEGNAWMLDNNGRDPIPAFSISAAEFGTTQFEQLQDYASKHGRLEEVSAP